MSNSENSSLPVAILGAGAMGAGIARLLTTDRWRLEESKKPEENEENPELFLNQVLWRQMAGGNPEESLKARAAFMASAETYPAIYNDQRIKVDGSNLIVDDKVIQVLTVDANGEQEIVEWDSNNVALIEATGALKTPDQCDSFIQRIPGFSDDGFMLTTHVIKDSSGRSAQIVVVGANEKLYQPGVKKEAISNGSCTTKAMTTTLAPIIEQYGDPDYIDGFVTHGTTGSQNLHGGIFPGNPTKGRSAESIIPAPTNASSGVIQVFPSLAGKTRPIFPCVRVPVKRVSFVSLFLDYPPGTMMTEEAVNDLLIQRAERYPGVFGVSQNKVSADMEYSLRSATVDLPLTQVVRTSNFTRLTLGAWYAHAEGSQGAAIQAAEYILKRRFSS